MTSGMSVGLHEFGLPMGSQGYVNTADEGQRMT
jgi:hypothetical protein